jgi:integrase
MSHLIAHKDKRATMALTQKGVRGLLARGEVGRHFDRDGLYLIVNSKTSANWERRYQLHGKARAMGLGSVKAFDLEQARERNRRVSQQLADGIDPLAAKQAERAAQRAAAAVKVITFREMAERYIADNQAGWKSAYYGLQWKRSLERYAYPLIGQLDIRAVHTAEVLEVLEQRVTTDDGQTGKFWEVYSVTADRMRNRIELILNYAMGRGHRDKAFNPAAWSMLKHVLPEKRKLTQVAHYPAVPYAEVLGVMDELSRREGVAAQALRFTILCATRSNETIGAAWDEIDLAGKTWTIPAARMKSGKEHKVPLSDAAIELLHSLYTEQGNPYLFIGPQRQKLSHGAMAAVLRRLGRTESVHGFRSSFSDFAHERTNHSNHTIEISLAHSVGSDVERSYRRSDLRDKRRQLMQQWGKFVTAPVKQATDNNVIGIGSKR